MHTGPIGSCATRFGSRGYSRYLQDRLRSVLNTAARLVYSRAGCRKSRTRLGRFGNCVPERIHFRLCVIDVPLCTLHITNNLADRLRLTLNDRLDLYSIIRLRRVSFYTHIMLSVSPLLRSIYWSFLIDSQHNSDVLSVFKSYSDALFSVRHDFAANIF